MAESESRVDRQVNSSWADEVEEEEALAQHQQNQKPNPFGSAKPREIVLQEKGIDWRKLDLRLQQKSLFRQEAFCEKSQKENIPNANLDVNLLAAQNKIHPVVPPLRFPPKNMIMAYNLYNPDNGQQDFDCRTNLKHNNPNGIQRSHCHDQRLQQHLKKNGSKVEYVQSLGKANNMQNPRRKFNGNEQHMPSDVKAWMIVKGAKAKSKKNWTRVQTAKETARS